MKWLKNALGLSSPEEKELEEIKKQIKIKIEKEKLEKLSAKNKELSLIEI